MANLNCNEGSVKKTIIPSCHKTDDMDELYGKYRHSLLRFFNSYVRNAADSEDLVQDVFVRISQSEIQIKNYEHYLFRIAANLVRDRYRRIRTQRAVDEASANQILPSATFSPERVVLDKELLRRLIATLRELPEQTRDTFSLYHFDSVPQVEIAKRYSTSISTIEKRMAKASSFLLSRCRQWDTVINL